MASPRVNPILSSDLKPAYNIIGVVDWIYWLFFVVGVVDYLYIRINFINVLDPVVENQLGIGFDILISGFVIRLGLGVYIMFAGGGIRSLMDFSLDAYDLVTFFTTFGIALIAVIAINAATPSIFSRFAGVIPAAVGIFMLNSNKLDGLKKKTKKRVEQFFIVFPLTFMMAEPLKAISPLVATYTTTPSFPKFFAVLMGISEEMFFRGALLPLFILVIFLSTHRFILSLLVGMFADESLFTTYHGLVYGSDPIALTIIFLSGITLAIAYLSGPLMGRPARISANELAHATVNYVASQ